MQPKFTFKKTYLLCWGMMLVFAVSLILPQNVAAQRGSRPTLDNQEANKNLGPANTNYQNPKQILFKNFGVKKIGGLAPVSNSDLKANASRMNAVNFLSGGPGAVTNALYCTPTATSADNTGLTNVTFGGINNTTTGATNAAGAYKDYTAIGTTLLTPGSSYNLGVRVNTDGNFTVKVWAWIDWNKDNVFDNSVGSTELYTLGQVTNVADAAPSLSPLSITVPVGANGVYTMRVRATFGAASVSNPCGNQNFSETEDYTINTPQPPCAGTPAPGAITGPSTACSGVGYTLGLTNPTAGGGVTYLWEYSTVSATGPWTSGGTSSTYPTSQTTNRWYRATVTCAGSGISTTTAVKAIALNPFEQCYCTPPVENCGFGDYITRVTIGTLNNTSACSANGFGDYKALTAPVVYSGTTNPITVVGVPYDAFNDNQDGYAVWIDLNRNGVYETSEALRLGDNLAQADATFKASINIPASVTPGITGLRVRTSYSFYPDGASPCDVISGFGETEEYLVNIQPCVPVTITTQPTSVSVVCGNTVTFTAATTGSLPVYSWQYLAPTAGAVWQTVTNGGIYSGATTNTLTLTPVTAPFTGYQYRLLVTGGCSAPSPSNAATLTVTAIVPVVTPASATICDGTVRQLSLTNLVSTPVTTTFTGTGLPLAIPDGPFPITGTSPTVPFVVSGIPAGAVIQNVSVNFSITHPYVGDLVMNLKDPSGQKLNLFARLNGAQGDNATANFTNTKIDMLSTTAISGAAAPRSGTYAAERYAITNPNYGDMVVANTSWAALLTQPNGTWQISVVDLGAPDAGSVTAASISITYTSPVFAQGTWTGPAGTIFTDAAGLTAYTGTPATTVYVKPTVAGVNNYQVSFATSAPCTSATTTIPVTVVKAITNLTNPANTTVCVGGTATFTTSATAAGGTVAYQWQVSTDGGANYTNITTGGTSATLTLTNVAAIANNNRYRAVVTGAPCGALTTTAATLTVNPAPVVTIASPVTQLVPGRTTTITATSTTAGLVYAFTRNNVATGVTGTTQFVSIDSLGTYRATGTLTGVSGCSTTSNALVIGTEASERLWIYPNPTDGAFQVRLFQTTDIATRREVSVWNSNGQMVARKTFDFVRGMSPYYRMDFDLSRLAPGTYLVKATEKNTNRIVSGLVVIQ